MTPNDYTDAKIDIVRTELLWYGVGCVVVLSIAIALLGNALDNSGGEEQCADHLVNTTTSCSHKDHKLELIGSSYACICNREGEK